MKYQPNANYNSNDRVMTPVEVAEQIVKYFKPTGKILEPAKGTGNFLQFLPQAEWCEIDEGKDFFQYHQKVDWIITNPPWSKIRDFLKHSLELADNVVFLLTINHIWTKARQREISQQGFGIKEIVLLHTPKNFPQSGFQLGAVHLQRHYSGDIKFNGNKNSLQTETIPIRDSL